MSKRKNPSRITAINTTVAQGLREHYGWVRVASQADTTGAGR